MAAGCELKNLEGGICDFLSCHCFGSCQISAIWHSSGSDYLIFLNQGFHLDFKHLDMGYRT